MTEDTKPSSGKPRQTRTGLTSTMRDTDLLPLVTQAARQGVAWAFLTRWLDEIPMLRKVNPQVDVFSVSADQVEIGLFAGDDGRGAAADQRRTAAGRAD